MSRTIRRTKFNKQYSRLEKNYTHHRLEEYLDLMPGYQYRNNGMPFVSLEGQALKIAWWKFHLDNGFASFGFEQAFERPWQHHQGCIRQEREREIYRWINDQTYEIQDIKPKQIYDYC